MSNNETQVNVRVDTVNKVKKFIDIVSKSDYSAELKSDTYIVDAKSIMGVFSLDVSKPVELIIHAAENETEDTIGELKNNGLIED